MMTFTPSSMKSKIWYSTAKPATKKHWSYKPHQRNKLVVIAQVIQKSGKFFLNGQQVDSFEAAKSLAKTLGFDMVRMGAIKAKL